MRQAFSLISSIKRYLVPCLEEGLGPLTAKEAGFVRAAELAGFDAFLKGYL